MATNRKNTGRTLRSGSDDIPTRRQWLATVGAGAVTFLAGCTDGDSGGMGDQGDDDPGGSDADEGADDDPPESDDPDDSAQEDDEDDDTSGTDDSDETETEADVPCGEVVPDIEDSVEVEGTMEHPEDGTVDLKGRTHEDDKYFEFVHSDGSVFELFIVDDEFYNVSESGCVKFSSPPGSAYPSLQDDFGEEEFWEERDPVRTDLLDGEEMVVYDMTGSTPSYDYESTVYVSCDTERIHRIDEYVPEEDATTIAYYTNWGGADPISPPDMDCEEF